MAHINVYITLQTCISPAYPDEKSFY